VSTTPKRTFVSGYPWWFSAAFCGFCALFAMLSIALSSWPLLRTVIVMVIGSSLFRLSSPQVHLGDDCLYTSRIGRKATIPLDHIASITETKSLWPFRSYSAVIHFTTGTPFGRSLYLGSFGFVPSMTFPWALKKLRRALDELATKRSSHTMELTASRRTPQLSND
jgi:hypothetical protein